MMITAEEISLLDWQKGNGLLPVIIQHAISGTVLMLGYMDQQALQKTVQSGKVTFFSRSKQRLWTKGESSGHFLHSKEITYDCDHDSLLVLAYPEGNTCHLERESCFVHQGSELSFLYQLEQLLAEKKTALPDSSYTARLYASGSKRIAQKVGEEGVECALAAVAGDSDELTNEAADLLYHLLVLLQDQNLSLREIVRCLQQRHIKSHG